MTGFKPQTFVYGSHNSAKGLILNGHFGTQFCAEINAKVRTIILGEIFQPYLFQRKIKKLTLTS